MQDWKIISKQYTSARKYLVGWSLNSIKVPDHDYELTGNENFNLILEIKIAPTEVVAAFQSLERRKAKGIDRSSGDVINDTLE